MHAGYEVIALGDINDFSVEPPDIASSKPKSFVLDMLTGTLPSSVSVPGMTSTPRLYNVMEKIPQVCKQACSMSLEWRQLCVAQVCLLRLGSFQPSIM